MKCSLITTLDMRQKSLVKDFCIYEMVDSDASHNAEHAMLVTKTALTLAAEEESLKDDPLRLNLLWLVAMLHDIGDHKYDQDGSQKARLENFLLAHWSPDVATQVLELISKVSWSQEQKRIKKGENIEASDLQVLNCIQDADRLQAIGAIGLVRCITYGATHGGNLKSHIDHIHEKLLQIRFKTAAGQRLATYRQAFLKEFIDRLTVESILSDDLIEISRRS